MHLLPNFKKSPETSLAGILKDLFELNALTSFRSLVAERQAHVSVMQCFVQLSSNMSYNGESRILDSFTLTAGCWARCCAPLADTIIPWALWSLLLPTLLRDVVHVQGGTTMASEIPWWGWDTSLILTSSLNPQVCAVKGTIPASWHCVKTSQGGNSKSRDRLGGCHCGFSADDLHQLRVASPAILMVTV